VMTLRRSLKMTAAFVLSVVIVLLSALSAPFVLAADNHKGSDYSANQYVAGRLDVILSEFPVGSYYTFDGKACDHHGSGCSYFGGCNCRSYINDPEKKNKQIKFNSIQCMGFAHYCFYKIFGFIDRKEYDTSLYYSLGSISSSDMTAGNCRKLLLQAQTGAHIRIANKHSMVYLSGNDKEMTVLHCNADAQCGISVKTWTWESFASNFKSWGIGYVNMPKTYPNSSGKSIVSASRPQYTASSSVKLNWTQVGGVDEYTVKIYSYDSSDKSEKLVKTLSGLSGSTTTISGLTPNTVYRAYIYCSSSSSPDSSAFFYVAETTASVYGQTVREGVFGLKNRALSQMMNVNGSITADNVSVNTASYTKKAAQQFYFSYVGDGMYKIYSASADSTKVLSINIGLDSKVSSGDALNIFGVSAELGDRQLFYIVPQPDGTYCFESVSKPGFVLNAVSGDSIVLKAKAQSASYAWSFCDLDGKETDPTVTSAKYVIGVYKIATESTSLNVREGAGTSYAKAGTISKGATVTVTAIDGDWGYITHGSVSGWISLEYTTFVSASITSISIDTMPEKVKYSVGDKIDSTGLTIKVFMSDGTAKTESDGFELDYDFTTAGKKTVVVNYEGKTTTYPVTVLGEMPSEIMTELYHVNAQNGYLTNVPCDVTLDEFLGGFYAADFIRVYSENKEISAETKIGTGMVIKLTDGNTVNQTLTIIVTGDANGDGTVNITDMISLRAHILEKNLLEGIYLLAADTSDDGVANITDYIQMRAHILEKTPIKAHK